MCSISSALWATRASYSALLMDGILASHKILSGGEPAVSEE